MQHGVAVAKIGVERRQRRTLAPDRVVGQLLRHELVAPGDHMGARYIAELLGSADTYKDHEVFDVLLVGPAGIDVGKPLDLWGHIRQSLELSGGERLRGDAGDGEDRG